MVSDTHRGLLVLPRRRCDEREYVVQRVRVGPNLLLPPQLDRLQASPDHHTRMPRFDAGGLIPDSSRLLHT